MNFMDAVLTVYVREGPGVVPEGIAAWARTNRFCRATVNRHLARIRAEGVWQERSRRPKGSALATPEVVRREVVRIRVELSAVPGGDVGLDVVRARLEAVAADQGWRVPARSTIHKILVQAGLVDPAPAKRPKSSYRRFTYARPRDCYQIDGTDVSGIVGFPATVIEVIDDHSRVLVASHACVKETSTGARAALRQAFDAWGVPGLVLSDKRARLQQQVCNQRRTVTIHRHGDRVRGPIGAFEPVSPTNLRQVRAPPPDLQEVVACPVPPG
jgi:hypothetical protein